MSVTENSGLYHVSDEEKCVEILMHEFGAAKHPGQNDAYSLEEFPFHAPRLVDDQTSIQSFNDLPFPDSLLEASADHSELFSDTFWFAGRKTKS
jgi:hypothetical protein